MLDFRFETFITLCQTMNYTQTAKRLNLTQPAVTQHIQYLERKYEITLFHYEGKKLSLTKQGKVLQSVVATMHADSNRAIHMIQDNATENKRFTFGATLTIGEYTLPKIIGKFLGENPNTDITMHVDNTEKLLSMLNQGTIEFAFIEGHFNKAEYSYQCFSKENFIAVCSPQYQHCDKQVRIEDILNERLILREKGSGTRNIFEMLMHEHNMDVDAYRVTEIGNLNVIKSLVAHNLGITFVYEEAVRHELDNRILVELDIIDLNIIREFNFVYLKNIIFEQEILNFFEYCKHNKYNIKII